MSHFKVIFRGPRSLPLLLVSLLALLVAPSSASAACWTWSAEEAHLMKLVNQARTSRGLVALQADVHVGRVSRWHATEMRNAAKLYHTPLSTLGWRVTSWKSLGENIGRMQRGNLTARQRAARMFRMFMDSPTHRANILARDYRFQAVGVVYGGGHVWLTHTFESASNPGTRLSMPSGC